jgi:hypothetical protein
MARKPVTEETQTSSITTAEIVAVVHSRGNLWLAAEARGIRGFIAGGRSTGAA